ncbi:MAG: flippase-like domain-containing protein [Flavobacteriales bacterium]|nr:flippase-like domain-containing protein [Flavobacteriales bacterium]
MSVGRVLLIVFRWGIFLLACAFLVSRFQGPKGILTAGVIEELLSRSDLTPLFMGVFALMMLNWGIEAAKWRVLIRPVESVRPLRSFVATIAGTSVGLVSVNRTGELIGRVLFLKPENRVRGGFATALGSIAQFVVTLVLGGLGMMGLVVSGHPLPWPGGWLTWVIVSLTALSALVALLFYLHPALLRQLLMHLPFLSRLERASSVLGSHKDHALVAVLLLSGLRYFVFTGQFVILLSAFDGGVPITAALLGVPMMYLIATLIPTVMLTELGVRGSVAVAVFGPLGGADSAVLLATTCLWTINVAFPACVGSVILLLARIRTRASG